MSGLAGSLSSWMSVGCQEKCGMKRFQRFFTIHARMLRNVQNLEFHGIQSSLSSFSFGCFHHGIPPGFITPDDFCALHSALAMCFEDFGNRMSSDIEQRGRVR